MSATGEREDVDAAEGLIEQTRSQRKKVEGDIQKIEADIQEVNALFEIVSKSTEELKKHGEAYGHYALFHRMMNWDASERGMKLETKMMQLETEKTELNKKSWELLKIEHTATLHNLGHTTGIGMQPARNEDDSSGLFYIKNDHRASVGEHGDVLGRTSMYTCENVTSALKLVGENGEFDIEELLKLVPKLDQDSVRNAERCTRDQYSLASNTDMGDMVYQQTIYSSFSNLFVAAAGGVTTKRYAADQDVRSSLSVMCKEKSTDSLFSPRTITMKPDSTACLGDRRDAFGMMEIKPKDSSEDTDYLIDKDKCALMTAATAKVLHNCFPSEAHQKVALPYIVATGKFCLLCVAKVTQGGHPYVEQVQLPGLSQEGQPARQPIDCQNSPSKSQSMIFVALAVLLNGFMEFFETETRSELYRRRYPTSVAASRYPRIFSKKRQSDQASNQAPENSQRAPKRSKQKDSAENQAAEAGACGGKFLNLEYPFTRSLRFTDTSVIWEEQTESPFYFVCRNSADNGKWNKKIFLKVWRVADVEVESVESEWRFLNRAHAAGVPVAAPFAPAVYRPKLEDGTEYLVMAMEFVRSDAIEGLKDLWRFSVSFLNAVQSLHEHARLLHCDLTPGNVIWSDGIVKLIDFGRAQAKCPQTVWCPGTTGYEAPEIIEHKPHTPSTDAYSAGKSILYELDKVPLGRDSQEPTQTKMGYLRKVAENVCHNCPQERWSVSEAKNALDSFVCINGKGGERSQAENVSTHRPLASCLSPVPKLAKMAHVTLVDH